MSSLHDQVEQDLRSAMKARDRERTAALRMAVSALKNAAVAAGAGPQGRLDDEAVQQVLATEVKKRREAAAAFDEAGRTEQAAAERAEAEVYAAYLPEQLSDEDLERAVDDAIATTGASGPADMGAVMKAAMAATRGRADGSRVSAIAKAKLTG